MRVLHYRQVFSKLSETFIYDRLTELERQGVDNHVVTRERTNAETRPFPSITEVDWPKKWDPWRLASGIRYRLDPCRNGQESYRQESYRRLAAVARGISADVIHAHFGREGVFIAPVAERLGIPLVVTFYGYDISQLPRHPRWRESYERVWQTARAIVVLSEEMKRQAVRLGAPSDRVHVVHLARDLEDFSYRPPEGPVSELISVGRLTEKKGHLDAIRAVQRVEAQGGNLRLRIVGEGPQRDELEQYVQDHALQDTVELLGTRPNSEVGQLLRRADAFMLCSKTAASGDREGTPTVLIEAQAVGLPCVSTTHAGIPEMMPEEAHPLLAPEGDVDALVNCIRRLRAASTEERRRIAEAGRTKIENAFGLATEAEKLRDLYRAVQKPAPVS